MWDSTPGAWAAERLLQFDWGDPNRRGLLGGGAARGQRRAEVHPVRVFLSIWLAFLLVLGGFSLAVAPSLHDDAPHPMGEAQRRQWSQTEERLRLVQSRRGVEGLKRFAADLRENRGIDLWMLAPDGHDLLGQALPSAAQAAAREPAGEHPLMTWREQRLMLGPAVMPGVSAEARVLLWMPRGEDAGLRVADLWHGPGLALRALVAVAASGLVSGLLAWSLTRPLRRLQRAALALAEGRHDDDALAGPLRRRDEIGDLARAFDGLARRLQAAQRSRHRLLRDVSHELRSPLARLQAGIELAAHGAPAATQARLARMEADCRRLDDMIGGVLALARAGPEDDAIVAQPVDLVPVLRGLVEDAAFEGEPQGKAVALDVPDALPVEGDEALLASAIENVLRNALRHAPDGSTVEVSARGDDAWVEVRVADRGPGVPEAELSRIFEPFHRVAEARERSRETAEGAAAPLPAAGGAGVGLAITARVARRHGGHAAASLRAGGGLVVTFRLRRHPARHAGVRSHDV